MKYALRNIFYFILVAQIGLITACKKNEDDATGNGQIKVVNTVAGSNPQHFYQNENKISVNPIAYNQSSNYFSVKSGVNKVSFRDATTDMINAESTGGITEGSSYTLFDYATTKGTGAAKGIQNDNTMPAAGKIRLRFVNFGSVLSNNINISLPGAVALVTGLAYFNYSNYLTIDANTSLDVQVVGTNKTTTIPPTAFEAGKIYIIWFDALDNSTVNYHIVNQN